MLLNKHKKNKTKETKKAALDSRRLRIKKELETIIEKTEEQNKALAKIIEKTRK